MSVESSARQLTDYFRTPLNAVLRTQSTVSGNELNLQGAFYNVAAFVFVSVGLGAAVAAYFVLEAFIKPLLWAALCGAFLYPFKKTFSTTVRSWLRSLSDSNTPLAVGVVLLPFHVLNETSALVGFVIFGHVWELLSLIFTSFVLYLLYIYQPFYEIFLALHSSALFLYHTLDYFSNPFWVWSLVIGFLIVLIFFWSPSNAKNITFLAYPVWVVLLLHLASIAGHLRIPLSLFLLALCVIGLLAEVVKTYKGYKAKRSRNRLVRSLSVAAAAALNENVSESDEEVTCTEKTEEGEIQKPFEETCQLDSEDNGAEKQERAEVANTEVFSSSDGGTTTETSSADTATTIETKQMSPSNIFFLGLFWAIGLVCIMKNLWVMELLIIPLVVYVIKMVLVYTGADVFLYQHFLNTKSMLQHWANERKDVLAPLPVRGLVRTAMLGDKKMVLWIEQFMDKLISIFMILCLIVGTVVLGAIVAVQVQRESMHLVKVTGNVVNDAITQYPDLFRHWLPEDQDFRDILQNALDQMYLHGRIWLSNKIRDMGSGKDSNNTQIEKDILELTDRLYHSWRQENNSSLPGNLNVSDISDNNSTANTKMAPFGLSLHNVFTWARTHKSIDLSAVFDVVKENIGTLLSVLESIWLLFKSNVSLAFGIVTSSLSLVFSSGTYLLNTALSIIVFLTALFYLLSFSQDQYLPVEWVSTLSGNEASLFGQAIFTAIRGVFGASLKMAAFYGLYTWLTHTLFGVKIVFIPSAIAAVTGVVPFVASYWAAVPAILELWLIDGKEIPAILLAICHVLPTYVVDTVIYSEIKGGGHPYLTGLAVAGGIYCLGLEGAIVGPIVLCCLVAAFNVHKIIIQGPVTPTTA